MSEKEGLEQKAKTLRQIWHRMKNEPPTVLDWKQKVVWLSDAETAVAEALQRFERDCVPADVIVLEAVIEKLKKDKKELQEALENQKQELIFPCEFEDFFRAMSKEMKRHSPQKGDSWKTMPINDLTKLLAKAMDNFWVIQNYDKDMHQLLDIANICALLYLRKAKFLEDDK